MFIFGNKKKKDHYSVYVVKLSNTVRSLSEVKRQNPLRKNGKPCVYVGMTGLSIKNRLKNHKKGYKSSKWVKNYGEKLLPSLYRKYNPMNYRKALEMESGLAVKLRKKGYIVLGGH